MIFIEALGQNFTSCHIHTFLSQIETAPSDRAKQSKVIWPCSSWCRHWWVEFENTDLCWKVVNQIGNSISNMSRCSQHYHHHHHHHHHHHVWYDCSLQVTKCARSWMCWSKSSDVFFCSLQAIKISGWFSNNKQPTTNSQQPTTLWNISGFPRRFLTRDWHPTSRFRHCWDTTCARLQCRQAVITKHEWRDARWWFQIRGRLVVLDCHLDDMLCGWQFQCFFLFIPI